MSDEQTPMPGQEIPSARPGEPDGGEAASGSQDEPSQGTDGEKLYAVSYPPAMYAADVLRSREFAEALGYGWLHEEDTEFVRAFREQVRRQAELYQEWLDRD